MFVQRRNGNSSVSSDPGERYIRVPEHGLSNSSSYEMSAASAVLSPLQSNVAAGEYPSVFPAPSEVTSVRESGDDGGESYIRLEDCYSGQPVDTSSTLPLVSSSHGGRSVSPNKASKQVIDADLKVEYCNEYELGEHNSMFVTNNSKCSYAVAAVGGCECVDNDDDDDDDVVYSHYKYPTVRYGIQSALSELRAPRNITGCHFREPRYVNCSNMFDRNLSCPPTKRHGICCDLVLTYPEVPQMFLEQSLSLSTREQYAYSSDSLDSCRLYSYPSATGTSKVCAGTIDNDGEGADIHDYVNVPPWHSVVQVFPPLSGGATSATSARYPDFIKMEAAWRK